MLTITHTSRTNSALRHATALSLLAQNTQTSSAVKSSMLGALWQLEFAQQAWCQEILQATHITDLPTNLTTLYTNVEDLIGILQKYDRVIPELIRLAQLRQKHPALQLTNQVASSGDLTFTTNNTIIGSSVAPTPTPDALNNCCEELAELIEQCRETSVEW